MIETKGKLLLFESGSTKTTVLICDFADRDEHLELTLSGFNPNRPTENLFNELAELNMIQPSDHIVFYGSGLGSEEGKAIVKGHFNEHFQVKALVYDDILAAGCALYKNKAGLLAICGTGGCVAYYNGKEIEQRAGGYGYLIDDYGGGFELGKITLTHWLNGNWPLALDKALERFIGMPKENFIQSFYRDKDLTIISDAVKVLADFKEQKEVEHVVEDYFHVFFKRHVVPLANMYETNEIRVVGSVAAVFSKQLSTVAKRQNLTIAKIEQFPARELLYFHLNRNEWNE